MTRLVRLLALALLVVFTSTPAYAQKGLFAVPKNADLEKYPIFSANRPLTVMQIAEMHLHPLKLTSPVVVQNHFRGLHGKEGRFVVEELTIGTLVLVDENGNLRYKADCGNRLVEFDNWATVRGPVSGIKVENLPSTPIQNGTPSINPAMEPPTKSWLGRIWDWWNGLAQALKGWALGTWNFIGSIFGPLFWGLLFLGTLLLLLLAIALLVWVIRDLLGYHTTPVSAWSGNPPTIRRTGDMVPDTRPLATPVVTPPATTSVIPELATAPGQEAADTASDPKTVRNFLKFVPGIGNEPNMVRTGGTVTLHSIEHQGDLHTIRYRVNQ